MKKIVNLLLAIILVVSLSACHNDGGYDKYEKIANNLYEVTVSDYDYDYLFKNGRNNYEFLYGCSAIKEGNYLGRNFDFIAGDASEIVVKTPSNKNHYASIGMVGGLLWLTEEFMKNGLDEDSKNLIPLMLLDGINEKGLCVETNCVNAIDIGGITMHTNLGKPQLPQLCVVRYLLDKAASADEAVEMMKNIDIVNTRDVMGLVSNGFEVHFLIADKDKSYVVEFDNTKPNGEKLIVMENESIMTNFYLHLANVDKEEYADYSIGVERYRKLKDNRNAVSSLADMKLLMQSVKFSNSNKLDGEYAPGELYDNPYTCFSDHPELGEITINYANYKEHLETVLQGMARDELAVKNLLKDPTLNNPNGLWVTSHNSVYDLKNKTMSVCIFERYDTYYDYAL